MCPANVRWFTLTPTISKYLRDYSYKWVVIFAMLQYTHYSIHRYGLLSCTGIRLPIMFYIFNKGREKQEEGFTTLVLLS